jgi:hypothetical protein
MTTDPVVGATKDNGARRGWRSPLELKWTVATRRIPADQKPSGYRYETKFVPTGTGTSTGTGAGMTLDSMDICSWV